MNLQYTLVLIYMKVSLFHIAWKLLLFFIQVQLFDFTYLRKPYNVPFVCTLPRGAT